MAEPGRYLERDDFLGSAFAGVVPYPRTLWITDDVRAPVEQALGRSIPLLRVSYWRAGDRTAWILDEIGKEEPITIGVVVNEGMIEAVRVLEFRESRGWEVRYPFFTDQYTGARLQGSATIDKRVDAITGATLSVRAVGRAVQTALLLHHYAVRNSS
jgi:hypothetical protein